jgi:hypothetical protein
MQFSVALNDRIDFIGILIPVIMRWQTVLTCGIMWSAFEAFAGLSFRLSFYKEAFLYVRKNMESDRMLSPGVSCGDNTLERAFRI